MWVYVRGIEGSVFLLQQSLWQKLCCKRGLEVVISLSAVYACSEFHKVFGLIILFEH